MRLECKIAGVCAGLLLSLSSLADPLPQRWISAGGAASEWIVALGGEARLVGVDSTSQHPASVTALPSVGYQRQLSAEGILALEPDLMLGTEEMGPPPVLSQLASAGVRVEQLSAASNLTALADNLTRLGVLLGKPQTARTALAGFQARIDQLQTGIRRAQVGREAPQVLLLVGQGGSTPLIAGRNTVGDWMLEQAGAHNLASHEGYRTLSSEALAAMDPDWLVISDRQLRGVEAQQAVQKQNPSLADSRVVREGHLLTIDPTLLVGGLGPRLPETLEHLAQRFYPALPALTAEASP